jgi:hypothetical protein
MSKPERQTLVCRQSHKLDSSDKLKLVGHLQRNSSSAEPSRSNPSLSISESQPMPMRM